MIEILAEIAENPKNKPYSRVNAADKLLEKALKFDEAHFQRVELAKVREILEDSEAGRSPIIEIQSDWYGSDNFDCLLLRPYVILVSWFSLLGLLCDQLCDQTFKNRSAPLAQLDRATAF